MGDATERAESIKKVDTIIENFITTFYLYLINWLESMSSLNMLEKCFECVSFLDYS
jgi:hypothetical protein